MPASAWMDENGMRRGFPIDNVSFASAAAAPTTLLARAPAGDWRCETERENMGCAWDERGGGGADSRVALAGAGAGAGSFLDGTGELLFLLEEAERFGLDVTRENQDRILYCDGGDNDRKMRWRLQRMRKVLASFRASLWMPESFEHQDHSDSQTVWSRRVRGPQQPSKE